MSEFNIVELLETNPITKLKAVYQSKLIAKLQATFTEQEQQMFVASFYGYLNYNVKTDFVIDLDNVWGWLGFYKKDNAVKLLERHFKPDLHYIRHVPDGSGAKGQHGGHNKIKIMLTVNTFKLFCLKACTKKADQIHNYYMKLEEILQDIVSEETNELVMQLQNHVLAAQKEAEEAHKKNDGIREKALLDQFGDNVQCVYYGCIDNSTDQGETLVKFGNSNFLRDRVDSHKRTFKNFRLMNAFKVDNKLQIENAIKQHPLLRGNRRTVKINAINQTELLAMNQMSGEELDAIIQGIITSVEYSVENYRKLLEENHRLKKENTKLIRKFMPKKEHDKMAADNMDEDTTDDIVYNDADEYTYAFDKKKIVRQPDGLFHIEGKTYDMLQGTRQQVWDEKAYRTVGLLVREDLLTNGRGKIVSKKKFITALEDNRLNKKRRVADCDTL